jgi:hypothetical protein
MVTILGILETTHKHITKDYSDSYEKEEVLELINELHDKLKKLR